ncbi:MAG: helix-hairpin-helix domain-containing protein [Phycisphaerales bacterium]
MPNSRPLSTLANVGKATLGDFEQLGIRSRAQLARRDAYRLYERLCALTAQRHDPCVIDVFLATISECRGNPPRAWWVFTPERKRALAADPSLAPTATRTAGASRSAPSPAGRAARPARSRGAAKRTSR